MRESGEMYLETILSLGKEQDYVRSIDVAERMGYSKASVSRAMSKLRTENCILMNKEGCIALTEKGRGIAEKIFERHQVLTRMLTDLGVDLDTAVSDACRIEHVISDESFLAVKKHVEAQDG